MPIDSQLCVQQMNLSVRNSGRMKKAAAFSRMFIEQINAKLHFAAWLYLFSMHARIRCSASLLIDKLEFT